MNKVALDSMINLFEGVIPQLLIFVGLIISISLFWKNDLILFIVLGYSLLHLWYLKIYRTDDIIVAVILGFGFIIGEIVIVKSGAWNYSNTTYACIPMWLYFAWCHIIMVACRISNAIGFWLLMTRMSSNK